MLYPLQLFYLTMADLDSNINPLPRAAGKFFAGIHIGIRAADKNARDKAEVELLPTDVRLQINNYREQIKSNEQLIQKNTPRLPENSITIQTFKRRIEVANRKINQLLTDNKFEEKYANTRNEKRTARKRKREQTSVQVPLETGLLEESEQPSNVEMPLETNLGEASEPSSVQLPSDAEVREASEEADAAMAAADKLLEEPENELQTAPAIAQAIPPTETASTNANKLAKVLIDTLLSAAQSSVSIPSNSPLKTEDV